MKEKEVKRLINHLKEGSELGRMPNSSIDIIIEALEKQIPQEPLYVDNAFPECCPRCYEAIESNKDNFCSKCGQALKWG